VNRHIGVVSILWAAAGVALIATGARGLMVESHFESVVASWLITLACGALAVISAALFWRRGPAGRVLIRAISTIALIYAAAWLLLGGIEDAGTYWPWIMFSTSLAVYGLWVCGRVARAV
jgi:hypothetical protein